MQVKNIVINKINKFSNRERAPKVVKLLRVFASLLFFLLILLLALIFGTTEKGLRGMTRSFVSSKSVNENYYEHYVEYGFSEESCRKILHGEKIKYLTADIMAERLRVVFRSSDSFETSFNEAKSVIRKELSGVATEQEIELDSETLEKLVNYTADISGISNMFYYDTPSEYRAAVLNPSKKEDGGMSDSLLQLLTILSSPLFIILILMMFIIVMVILYFLDKRDKKLSFLNITLYPALALLGFSIGEVFMPDAPAITDYVFRLISIASVIGVGVGIGIYFLIRLLDGRREAKD